MNKSDLIMTMLTTHKAVGDNPEVNKITLSIWLDDLADYSAEEIYSAWKKYRKDNIWLNLPTLLEFLDPQKPTTESVQFQAQEQWQLFYVDLVSRQNPKFEDPITAYIAQDVVNIYQAKSEPPENIKFSEKRFIQAYVDAHSSERLKQHAIAKAMEGKLLFDRVKKQLALEAGSLELEPVR